MIRTLIFATMLGLLGAACQAATPTIPENPIAYGQTVRGQLAWHESRWLFKGQHGDTISLEFKLVGQANLPPVAVIDATGASLARISPDTGRLDRFRLPGDGQFAIVVGEGEGSYTLSLRQAEPDAQTIIAPPTPSPLPITDSLVRLGEARTGSLKTGDAQDLWAFNGQADTVITVRMDAITGDLNPTLRLFAPDGSLLASDQNPNRGRSALIGGLHLPVTGIYFIRASGGGRIGDYSLNVLAGAPIFTPTPTPLPTVILPTEGPSPTPTITPTVVAVAQNGAQIRVGQTVQGAILSQEQVDRFAVFGPAGAVISVGMFPADNSRLVPSFVIYAPNGDQVAQAAGPAGAVVTGLTLPATGAYIIYATADKGQSSGAYNLTVGDGFTLRDLNRGSPATDSISQGLIPRIGDREVWTLDLPANATFSVETASEQSKLDTLVEILAPDGKVLATAQANPTAHTARIPSLVTAQPGRYVIRVSAAKPGSVGSYLLTARVLKVVPTVTVNPVLDQTINAEVDEGQNYTYIFQGVPGEVVLIDVRERAVGGFDPVIELYGPSGRRLAITDDSSPDDTNAVLQISLDDGVGAYTVLVHGYAMTPGAFTLHIKTE